MYGFDFYFYRVNMKTTTETSNFHIDIIEHELLITYWMKYSLINFDVNQESKKNSM